MNLTGKIVLVPSFIGCSYEAIARNLQTKNPAALVIMGKFLYQPGIEAFISDVSPLSTLTVPTVSLAIYPFLAAVAQFKKCLKLNETTIATVVPDVNPYRDMFESVWMVLYQVILGGMNGINTALAGYKLYLFAVAQKGISLNIAQVVLANEFLTNFIRFIWCAIDPVHGARRILPWELIKYFFTIHIAINCINLILIGFYWTDLVNNSTGSKSTFLQRKETKALFSFITLFIFGVEIYCDVLDSKYIGGNMWSLYICYFYMAEWATVGTWFLFCGFRLVYTLSQGGKKRDPGVLKVARRIFAVGLLLHFDWVVLLMMIYYGTVSASAYLALWFTVVFLYTLGSYLQIGIFNPPQWREKGEKARSSTSTASSTAAVRDAVPPSASNHV